MARAGVLARASMNPIKDVEDFIEYLRIAGKSQHTVRQYASRVYSFFEAVGKRSVAELTEDDVKNFVLKLREEASDPVAKSYAHALRAFFKFHNRPDLMRYVPSFKVESERIQWLPYETVLKIIRGSPVLAVAYDLALRVGEVLLLRAEEYDPATGTIVVHREKSGLSMLMKLGDYANALLRKYVEENKPKGQLFPYTRAQVNAMFKEALRRAGLDPSQYTFHVLRHSRATHMAIDMLLRRGSVDIYAIATFLGHSNLATVMRYVHAAQSYVASRLASR